MILFQNRRKIQGFLIFSLSKRTYLNRQRKRKEGKKRQMKEESRAD